MAPPTPTPTANLVKRLLQGLIILNGLYALGILAMLVASFIAPGTFFTAMGFELTAGDPISIDGMRLIMVAGLVAAPFNHAVLARLRAIVETVGDGNPFIVANAERLRSIAWFVLALEGIHLAIGGLAAGSGSSAQPIDIQWRFSFAPWLAIVLLFVLAQVFDRGARMRADLEGTV